ncbi:MAG: hypothetical protein H6707_12215 [Deltaproteobacteria bacterium]|nr:hypothetical protein [Deltaproteobacteria bacterium]
MNWLMRKLGAAVITGVGLKLGSDAYDAIKRRLNKAKGDKREHDVTEAAAASECDKRADEEDAEGAR